MDFIRFFEKRIDKYKAVCYTGTCIFTGKGGNPMGIFSKLFGSYSTRELARIEPIKQKVLALDEEYTALSDAELKGKTQEFRDRLESGETLDSMMAAIKAAGYEPGKDVMIGMDCASSEFYKNGVYDYTIFEGEKGKKRTSDEQIAYLEELITKYPIDSIEDGMSENDWDGWKKLTECIGGRCQLVGDDLFVTNVDFLSKGIAMGCANSILIKVNQIGSLSETLDAIEMAHRHGYTTVTSHRSGETEDATIADIAVATNSGQIKTGSLSRSDRMAKYNQLLRIEEELGDLAVYGYKRIK